MSQPIKHVLGAVKKCPHGQVISIAEPSFAKRCRCCGQLVDIYSREELCAPCRLGINFKDAPPEHIPEDYILDRGPVQRVFADERELKEAPAGYFKLLLGTTEIRPTFVTHTDIVNVPWNGFDDSSIVEAELGSVVCQLAAYTLIDVMCEAWRVLVNDGLLTISAPFHLHDSYIRDLRNITPICEDTFGFFSKQWCAKNDVIPYTDKCDFAPAGIRFHPEEGWLPRADMAKNWARAHYWGVVKKIEVVLKAVK